MLPNIVIPALIALAFKLVLLGYSIKSPAKNATTRLFLALLAVLALHNVSEVLGLTEFVNHGVSRMMVIYGFTYVALLIPSIALLLHISLRLSLDRKETDLGVRLDGLLYVPAAVLLCLLLFTDKVVNSFQPFQNTVLRVPGPWYSLFETYMMVYLSVALVNIVYGARLSRPFGMRRVRNRFWLLALLPTVLLLGYLIIANHFGLAKVTSTIYLPITLTFFLVVTTYAMHQYRLFDIELFIPGKVRKRKTAFHRRIQATIAEIANFRSVKGAIHILSDLLHCPVALVSGPRSVLAMGGEAFGMARFPLEELQKIEHIVVANEIAEAMPGLHALMKRHKVAAVVPFHPHSQAVSSWMLLGESFSEHVYSSLDFKIVERLFARLSDHFLDSQLFVRSQLAQARQEMHELHHRLTSAWNQLAETRRELAWAQADNLRLRGQVNERFDTERNKIQSDIVKRCRDESQTLEDWVVEFEARLIQNALDLCGGNRSRAAELLGLRPNTLHYKIQRYFLDGDKQDE